MVFSSSNGIKLVLGVNLDGFILCIDISKRSCELYYDLWKFSSSIVEFARHRVSFCLCKLSDYVGNNGIRICNTGLIAGKIEA